MSAHAQSHHNIYDQILPIVIVAIGLVVGLYLYLYLTSVEASVQRSLGSNLSPQSSIIATTPTDKMEDVQEEPVPDQELQSLLDKYASKQFATVAVLVQPLEGGSATGVNASTTFKAASLYKLFVAYETLLRVDEEELSLKQATGYDAGSMSIGNCLKIMIDVSDNNCGRALRKVLDVTEKPLPRLAELGFTGTSLAYDYPTTTAKDVALLFEKLYNQEDLSKKSNQLFLTHLKNQQINDRIPKGLPNGTEVAHKTGDLEGFAHDAGIIYQRSGDYILVILGGPWNSDTSAIYANYSNLTSQIHQHLTAASES